MISQATTATLVRLLTRRALWKTPRIQPPTASHVPGRERACEMSNFRNAKTLDHLPPIARACDTETPGDLGVYDARTMDAVLDQILGLLYGVVATDGTTLSGGAVAVLTVPLAACWRPAWRATRVDPICVLRAE